MVDLVYSKLSHQISTGALKGQLKITDLAKDYNVSPLPVREALRRLEAEGLVSFNKRRVSVKELSVEGLKELFAIRLALEPMLLQGCVPMLQNNEPVLQALRNDLAVMEREIGDSNEWKEANRVFHQRMYEVSSQKHLRSIVLSLWTAVEPYLRVYVSEPASLREAQKEHREMIRLIEAGDCPAVAELLTLHLQNTLKITEAQLLPDSVNNAQPVQ